MAITNKIGAPVIGEDFYGRKRELQNAHRYLDEKQSLLLSAPRRIGKSSISKRLIDEKKKAGWNCIYIDLEGIATKEAFLHKIIEAFTEVGLFDKVESKARDFLDGVLKRLKGVEIAGFKLDLNNREETEVLFNRVAAMFNHESNTLIVIDELPLFLGKLMDKEGQNRDEVEFFLTWLRSIRQHENSAIRWIFCGSVGLRNFANHHNMSHAINDLVDFPLGELPAEEAKGLLRALAQSYHLIFDEALIAETLNRLQWPIPYFIQLIIDRLIFKIEDPAKNPVTIENISEAIEELSHSDKFITWSERLAEYRELEKASRKILDRLSVAEDGLTKESILTILMKNQSPESNEDIEKDVVKILSMLEHDGYIIRSKEYRKFRSPLLREWWKYKFVD